MAFFFMVSYLLIINVISFIFYGIDKFLAYKHYFRISEKLLFFLAILGGDLGALLGMLFFRHKTLKFKFYLVNIIFLILWSFLLWK